MPDTPVTKPVFIIFITRLTASSSSVIIAPGCVRGTSEPSSIYPLSAKTSLAKRMPASAAASAKRLLARPSSISEASNSFTARHTAAAREASFAAMLYIAPCGLT